jgi:hypothetical protein
MNEERPLKMLALIAVGAVLLSCAGVYVATSRWTTGVAASVGGPAVSGGEAETVRVLQEQVQRDVEERAQRDRTLAEARASELLADLAETRAAVAAAQQALTQWNEQVPALLTSEQGKRVAADPERVQTFHAISSRLGRPSESQVGALAQRVELLERQLEQVRSSESATLSEDSESAYAKQLEEDQAEALGVQRELEEDLDAVRALVAKSATANPAPRSLAAALEELELEMATQRAELITRAVREVREEQNQLDVAMRREAEQRMAVEERRREKAKLDDQRMRVAAEASEIETKTNQDEPRLRAESAVIQNNYAPFLEDGKTQPINRAPDGPAKHSTWETSGNGIDKFPASFDGLRRARAFSRFEVFVQLATSGTNDRTPWAPLSESNEAEYRRRWTEFQELAPIWIEMGLLRP